MPMQSIWETASVEMNKFWIYIVHFFIYTGDLCTEKNTVQKQDLCKNNKTFHIITYPFYTVIFWSVVKRYIKWCGYIPQSCIGNTIHLPNVHCVHLLYTVVHLLHSSLLRSWGEHLYGVNIRTASFSAGILSIWAGLRGSPNRDNRTSVDKSMTQRSQAWEKKKNTIKTVASRHRCW